PLLNHLCFQYLSLLFLDSSLISSFYFFFFFIATPPPEIYTLSLHDALPISTDDRAPRAPPGSRRSPRRHRAHRRPAPRASRRRQDRKSTRLNSSHSQISYAVFCLKKKKQLQLRHNEAQRPDPDRKETTSAPP